MNPLDPAASAAPRYARFSRRLRGMLLDWMIAMAVLFGAVALASNIRSDTAARALGVAAVALLLLYEPLLVSRFGGTLGHIWTNLRVVDDRGGNVSFAKALARFVIKSLLGWYSFVIMAATRRNQTVHDLLTRSTVQMRDAAKARAGQFIAERQEINDAAMPSRLRRTLVTLAWLAVGIILYVVTLDAVLQAGLQAGVLSNDCLDRNYFCSPAERVISIAAAVVLLVMLAVVIGLGWRGRLFGARRVQPEAAA
ncbi:RDD family protein [Bradyrhizobium manausense]|uniref:RDD family protein n=1 Tax=Bradyrhizobium TaxID=374 RepID=UPI001BA6FA86|nr:MULTISPECIES: RDD family protein [Bradyrhizobium]MBR0826536.1 RDD family protein [Bradyrhizobium manausense]UVO28931.1 RDD family protein [Bradyrhizobium arachidis]